MRRAALALLLLLAGCMPRPQPVADSPEPLPAPGVRISIQSQHTTHRSAAFTLLFTNGNESPLSLDLGAIRLFDERGRELRRVDSRDLIVPPFSRGFLDVEFEAPLAEGRQFHLAFRDSEIPVTIAPRPHKPWFMCFPEFILDVTRGLCTEIRCGSH